jgi:hypothetical protein
MLWYSRGIFSAGLLIACFLLTACSSIKSRQYDVDNLTSDQRQVKRLKGIPTTLDVPTHVRITIEEVKYFKPSDANAAVVTNLKTELATSRSSLDSVEKRLAANAESIAEKSKELEKKKTDPQGSTEIVALKQTIAVLEKEKNDAATIKSLQTERGSLLEKEIAAKTTASVNPTPSLISASRSMSYELITQKELYTVDFKRPLVGSNDLKLEFGTQSGGQFLKKVGQTTVDTSITDIGDLIEKTATALPKLMLVSKEIEKNANDNKSMWANLFGIKGVVAVQCFDIRDPLLDQKIQQFLDQYINTCNPGCPTPSEITFGQKPSPPTPNNTIINTSVRGPAPSYVGE